MINVYIKTNRIIITGELIKLNKDARLLLSDQFKIINDTQNVYDDSINYMETTTKNNLDYVPKFKQYQ